MTDVAAVASAEIAGEANLCPHCRGQTRLEPSAELRWVCGVCGGPRVRVEDARARTKKSTELLLASERERKASIVRRFGAIGLGLTGALLGGLAATLGTVSVVVGVVLALVSLPMLFAAFALVLAARKRRREARRFSFEAWEEVAEALLRLHGKDATAEDMAALLGVEVAEAERVMTVLAAEDRARVDIGAGAELRYRVSEAEGEGAVAITEAERVAIEEAALAEEDARSRGDA